MAIWFVALAVGGLTTLLLIPKQVRGLAWQHCHDDRGRWVLRYAMQELTGVLGALTPWWITTSLVTMGLVSLVSVSDTWLLSNQLALKALSVFDPDPSQWRANLRSPAVGDLARQHREEGLRQGRTPAESRRLQGVLWRGFPVLLLISIAVSGLIMALLGQLHRRAFQEWSVRAHWRYQQRRQNEWDALTPAEVEEMPGASPRNSRR